ncbi:hypothetical protein K2173_021239 [Erythroxylum novogranatense]|uniref:Protein LURP-one-related 5-like n=1 Tax=Erythroxylum novogranatense TaxID=1862640 RepID=A0AAV8TQX3_9ROSI|nr:hypothetical protein K2173_021239 [Erythroxylum novogranatense]
MTGTGVVVDAQFCFDHETNLTVHKTSVFFPGDGFVVYNPDRQLILRSDSYSPHRPSDELVLMDASGKCLLTLLRKKPSLHQRWEGFMGERQEDQDPVFSMFKSSIIGRSQLVVEVGGDGGEQYCIEGSYSHRCCTIYNNIMTSSRECVAEIKRKVDPTTHVLLGKDVFLLCLQRGLDAAFAMGLVLVLDQIYGDDDDDNDGVELEEVAPNVENSSS